MREQFLAETRWAGVRFIAGLLDQGPALSLQLSADDCEFGAHDVAGTPIEERVPDYGILGHVHYVYPVMTNRRKYRPGRRLGRPIRAA